MLSFHLSINFCSEHVFHWSKRQFSNFLSFDWLKKVSFCVTFQKLSPSPKNSLWDQISIDEEPSYFENSWKFKLDPNLSVVATILATCAALAVKKLVMYLHVSKCFISFIFRWAKPCQCKEDHIIYTLWDSWILVTEVSKFFPESTL